MLAPPHGLKVAGRSVLQTLNNILKKEIRILADLTKGLCLVPHPVTAVSDQSDASGKPSNYGEPSGQSV